MNNVLSKRQQCVDIILQMGRLIRIPKDALDMLHGLDLSLLTDEQIDMIYDELKEFESSFKEFENEHGKTVFKTLQELRN